MEYSLLVKAIEHNVKRFGLTYKQVSVFLGIAEATMSNIRKGRKKISDSLMDRIEKKITLLDKIQNINELIEKYPVFSDKKISYASHLKVFLDGEYSCYYYGKQNIEETKFIINSTTQVITLKLGDFEYNNTSKQSELFFQRFDNIIELRLSYQDKYAKLFISYKNYQLGFFMGILLYVDGYGALCTTKIILIHESLDINNEKKILIKHYFRSRYLNHLKLSAQAICSFDDLKRFFCDQEKKGWRSIDFSEKVSFTEEANMDLFISTPISSLSYDKFTKLRSTALKIMDYLANEYQFEKIYYRGEKIKSEDDYKKRLKESLFHEEITRVLKRSKYFLFLDLEDRMRGKPPSTLLFQLGWILSHTTTVKGYLFVKDVNIIPHLIKHETLSNFKIVVVKDEKDLMNYIQNPPSKSQLFSDDDIKAENYGF